MTIKNIENDILKCHLNIGSLYSTMQFAEYEINEMTYHLDKVIQHLQQLKILELENNLKS